MHCVNLHLPLISFYIQEHTQNFCVELCVTNPLGSDVPHSFWSHLSVSAITVLDILYCVRLLDSQSCESEYVSLVSTSQAFFWASNIFSEMLFFTATIVPTFLTCFKSDIQWSLSSHLVSTNSVSVAASLFFFPLFAYFVQFDAGQVVLVQAMLSKTGLMSHNCPPPPQKKGLSSKF